LPALIDEPAAGLLDQWPMANHGMNKALREGRTLFLSDSAAARYRAVSGIAPRILHLRGFPKNELANIKKKKFSSNRKMLLRPIRDPLLRKIVCGIRCPDLIRYIALLAHCQPRHRYLAAAGRALAAAAAVGLLIKKVHDGLLPLYL
jgi:hypothetical protein